MCNAALSAARESFARAARLDAPPEFGVGLHVGRVIYGNVGTAKRHDFAATGPAVGIAARVEGLTKDLDRALLATAEFAAASGLSGEAMGTHAIRGFDHPVTLVAYDPDAQELRADAAQ